MNRIKNWFARIGILLGSIFGVQYVRPPVMDTTIPVSTPAPSPVPAAIEGPTYQLGTIKGATEEEKKLIIEAVNLDNIVVSDTCTEQSILKAEFTETNDLTNGQILKSITRDKYVLNFEFFDGTYMQNYVYKTMGYDVGDGVVYMNRFYVHDAKTIMSLSLHEGAHGKGFHHYNKWVWSSVPYKMNSISESCIAVIEERFGK